MSTTRQIILDTAEVCFAQRGYDATSLSDVGRLADVKPDAMNYHFGTKSALFDAVVRRRVEPMNESRFALLDAAIARHYPDPPPLEELVEAYIRPPVVAFASPARGTLLGLLRRVNEGSLNPVQYAELFGTVQERFSIMRSQLDPMTDLEYSGRWRFLIGGMVHLLSDRTWSGAGLDTDSIVNMVREYSLGVLRVKATLPVEAERGDR